MGNKLRRFPKATLVLGAATVTLLCLPYPTHAQSSAPQDRQAVQSQDRQAVQSDDITRRDLASFDRFLDAHREIAEQVRKDPSLLDNRNFVQDHQALQTYFQDNPGVRDQIRQDPNAFMRQEDAYDRDPNMRDRDAFGQDRDADRRDVSNRDGDRRDVASRDADRRDVASFDRFLDAHREIAEQVRRDPSLLDNRNYVQDHPALQNYYQDNPGVRDQIRQDPNAFMQQEDAYDRDSNMRDRDAGRQDRDADRRDVANFDRFLDAHREIAEQVRKDPSLLDNRDFVRDHPPLQAYLQENPGVRDQLGQNPNAFMRQEDAYDRNSNMGDRDPMHDHMADFGGFLHSHSDIQNDLYRDPSVVKDHEYVQNHAELDTYLNAHPDVRSDLMADPQSFVHGAQQYGNASPSGTSAGAGVSGRSTSGSGTGMTGSAGTSTNPETTPRQPKPNQ